MSETFTASNEVVIDRVDTEIGGRLVVEDHSPVARGGVTTTKISTWLDPRQADALREFFQYERDKELGRWRWPENPEYVVYKSTAGERLRGARHVTVSNESNGEAALLFEVASGGVSGGSSWAREAARAYFAAHPEPKPWHEAVEGEVWLLMFPNSTQAWFVNGGYFQNVRTLTNINKTDPGITAGRRIWPEVSDA